MRVWWAGVWASPERYDAALFRAFLVFLMFAIIFPWFAYALPLGQARASIGPANLILLILLGGVGVGLLRRRIPAPPPQRALTCLMAVGVLVVSLLGLTRPEPVVTQQLLVTGSAGVATFSVAIVLVRSEQRLILVLRWLVVLSTLTALMTIVASLPYGWVEPMALSTGVDPLSIGEESDLFFRRQAASFVGPDTATGLFALSMSVLVVGLLRPRLAVVPGGRVLTAGLILVHLFTVAIMQSISTYVSFLVLGAGLAVLAIGWMVPHRFARLARGIVTVALAGLFVAILAQVWGPTSGPEYYATIDERDDIFGITVDRVVFANMGKRVEAGQQVMDLITTSPWRFLFGTANTSLGATGAHPHNGFLQLMLTGGVLLTGAYSMLLVTALRLQPGGAPSPLRASLIIALGAALTQSLFYLGLYEKLLFLLVGLVTVAAPGSVAPVGLKLRALRPRKRETRASRRRRLRAQERNIPAHRSAPSAGR